MNTIDAPALRGDDSLGFLAAVGLLALSDQGEIPQLELAWRGRYSPTAVLRSAELASIDALGEALRGTFERLRATKGVIPGLPPDFPVPSYGAGQDPMRMPQPAMAALFRSARSAEFDHGNRWQGRWLVALAGQATIKDPKREDVQLTPFNAPTGQMKLRTSIFEKTMEAVERIAGPADALTGWRRVAYDGANFDERAKRDAAMTTSGDANNLGAPSPTWLAAMAIRFFPLADDGRKVWTVGWRQLELYPGYTRRTFTWPLWTPFLDPAGLRALLSHPALVVEPGSAPFTVRVPRSAELNALGVVGLYGASRRTLSQGDGPLGPTRRLWPSP